MVFGAKVGVTWWVSRGWFRSTLPIRDQGKVTLKGRRTGQRRREDRGLGERGSQERGRLPRIPGPGRERCPSGGGGPARPPRPEKERLKKVERINHLT